MMTPAILHPTSTPAGPVPPAKQNADAASSPPFGEVLSRQIAGRGASEAGSKGSPEENSNAAGPGQSPAAPAASKSNPAGKSAQATDSDSDDGDHSDVAVATASAELLMLVANLAEPDAMPADTSTAIAAVATAVAALPMKFQQEHIAGDAMESLAVPTAATALPDQRPVERLATAPAIQAASDAGQPPERIAAREPSARESMPALMTSAPLGAERRAATVEPVQSALSSAAPALSGQAASAPAMRAELTTAAPPVAALHSVASEPEMQAGVAVATPPAPQQAAFNGLPAVATPATDKLTPQVGTNGWDQAVGQKVVWMAAGAHSSASLTLNPPDLGPLQVALSVVNNQATISFTAAQPEVRQALEAAMPKLREMLGDAGIQMGQASVNAGAPQQHGGHGNSHQAPRGGNSSAAAGTAIDAPLAVAGSYPAGVRGLVDTFA